MEKKNRRRKNRLRTKITIFCVLTGILVLSIAALFYVISKDTGKKESKPKQMTESTQDSERKIQTEKATETVGTEIQEEESLPEETRTEELETEEASAMDPDRLLDHMTLEEKVAQLFVVAPEVLTGVDAATAAGDTTRAAISDYPVGGFVYFQNNIVSEEQFTGMVQNVQRYSEERTGLPMLICIDEEGGTVARISGKGVISVPDIPSMYEVGSSGSSDEAYQTGGTIGGYLNRLQINVDFAPVADVLSNPENTVIGSRSFGSDPEMVGEMVAAEVKGLKEQGVLTTLKHFPGHGDTAQDSHSGAAYSYKTMDELRECELIPFRAGIEAGADLVMMGHISLPNILEDDTPASLSYTMVTEVLRDELGFDGVVITDGMNMGAIASQYTSGDAAVRAIQAGGDMILMSADFYGAYDGVLSAVQSGTISEERLDQSLRRIFALKEKLIKQVIS